MKLVITVVALLLFVIIAIALIKGEHQKKVIGGSIIVFILLAVAYETFKGSHEQRLSQMIYAYEHNQSLQCGDITVNQENFKYEYATQSFLGKGRYKGKIIPLKGCKQQ